MKVDNMAKETYQEWMLRQKKDDPEFYHHVQQGNQVGSKFVDYHPNKSISYSGLEALDSNFIFNDPNDE